MSARRRWWAVAIVAAVAVASVVVLLLERQRALESFAAEQLDALAQRMRMRLEAGLQGRLEEIRILASRMPADGSALRAADARARLDDVKALRPDWAWIGLADPSGRVLVATAGLLEGEDVSARGWFAAGREAPALIDVHEAKLLARYLGSGHAPLRFIDAVAPVRDRSGRLLGVLGAHLDLGWARRVLAIYGDGPQPPVTLVLDREGRGLFGPEALVSQAFAKPAFRAVAVESGPLRRERWPDGVEYVVGRSSAGEGSGSTGLGWTVLVAVPAAELAARGWPGLWPLAAVIGGWALALALWILRGRRAVQAEAPERRIEPASGAMRR